MKKFLFIIFVLFIACEDNGNEPQNGLDFITDSEMVFEMNDENWQSLNASFNEENEFLTIIGKRRNVFGNTSILMTKPLDVGQIYDVTIEVTDIIQDNGNNILIVWISVENTCRVKIHSISDSKIAGSFSGKLRNNFGDTTSIQNGFFKALRFKED
jgi:hypothetical protein